MASETKTADISRPKLSPEDEITQRCLDLQGLIVIEIDYIQQAITAYKTSLGKEPSDDDKTLGELNNALQLLQQEQEALRDDKLTQKFIDFIQKQYGMVPGSASVGSIDPENARILSNKTLFRQMETAAVTAGISLADARNCVTIMTKHMKRTGKDLKDLNTELEKVSSKS